jgi:hypothetical protein
VIDATRRLGRGVQMVVVVVAERSQLGSHPARYRQHVSRAASACTSSAGSPYRSGTRQSDAGVPASLPRCWATLRPYPSEPDHVLHHAIKTLRVRFLIVKLSTGYR